MTHFSGEAAVSDCLKHGYMCKPVVTGYSWVQRSAHQFQQVVIKRCVRCRALLTEEVHWWDLEQPICLACGSQIVYTEDSGELSCGVCEEYAILVLEPKEQPDGSV